MEIRCEGVGVIMQIGSLVKFKDKLLPYVLPCEADRYKGKVGVIIETKAPMHPYHSTLFRIYMDGKNLEWFVHHELEVVCK